ncbi:hypothetical protein RB653_006910 [Dictyostelium firmibasis]|uniref:Transmembrane protein 242 n=1 Tax=Dictyostelium firmibasis TaxID=79012 RepID=A0AAN7YNJ2_9MYCE
MAPSFLNKEMPLSMFFVSAGCLSAVGFGVGLLVGLRKNGGIRQTIRTAPPGVVGSAVKALVGGTAICVTMTAGLVYFLKNAYNIETVKDFGDMMRGKKSEKIPTLILVEKPINQSSTLNDDDNNKARNNIIDFTVDESKLSEEEKLIHKENIKALKALKYLPYTDEDFKEINDEKNEKNEKNSLSEKKK